MQALRDACPKMLSDLEREGGENSIKSTLRTIRPFTQPTMLVHGGIFNLYYSFLISLINPAGECNDNASSDRSYS